MADSEGIKNACDVSIWVDNASGVLTEISNTTNSVAIALSKNVGSTPVFGSKFPRRRMCGSDCQIDFTILFSVTAEEAMDILNDWYFSETEDPRTATIFVPSKNVGSSKYSGEFVLETLNIPLTAGEGKPIEVTGRLLVDGEFTHTTTAT